jgi:hypothetical protein
VAVKLCQGQVWKKDGQYVRIVRLERLEVEYKSLDRLARKAGAKTVTSKKDFCRLLKGAHLLSARKKISADRVIPASDHTAKKAEPGFHRTPP